MEAYKDTDRTPEERARDLLSRLSLEEKMAQLVGIFGMTDMTDEQQKTFDRVLKNGIGQVSTLSLRNVKDVDFDTKWQNELQERIMKNSPHHIPAIFHMEGLCGAFLTGSTSFPAGISRGSSFDTELEEKIGAIVSRQELAAGITQTLAPVLDISRDSRMGRQGETYGEDPTLAASLGSAYVKGLQGQTVDGRHTDGCAKHFLGFHNSLAGIHGANVEMGQRMTEEIYGKPFQAAIAKSGLKGIMPCYCTLNGIPESASKWVLTTLLRDEMGFEGCAISDYGAVGNVYKFQGVGESLGDAGLMCLEAGMDTELPMPEAYGAELMQKMKNDPENLRYVDRAALRVLTAKFRMGLFEHPFALEGKEFHEVFSMPGDRDVSLQSARESMVLLKNDGVLPLA
ncbi:MAG: glycoside hydrolase family 3 protein, partial [Chordicoccus sp.]